MKLIKINESQHRRLFEGYQESFSFDDLSVLGDGMFNGEDNSVPQMAYCRKHLGEPDSMGSSRAVFTLSDNYVLKLAYGKKYLAGIEQNEAEYKLFQEVQEREKWSRRSKPFANRWSARSRRWTQRRSCPHSGRASWARKVPWRN